MGAKEVAVNVHHIREVKPSELLPADLCVFGSPGRFGKPIRARGPRKRKHDRKHENNEHQADHHDVRHRQLDEVPIHRVGGAVQVEDSAEHN